MLVIWLGALFVLGEVVFMMAQPVMRRNEHLREHHVTLWSLVGLVPGLH
jgi:hypothetical protein